MPRPQVPACFGSTITGHYIYIFFLQVCFLKPVYAEIRSDRRKTKQQNPNILSEEEKYIFAAVVCFIASQ